LKKAVYDININKYQEDEKMKRKNIKLIQWACRIIPVFTWSFYFFVLYLPENKANCLLKEPVWSIVFIFIIFSYILLVFLVLPGLIFGEKYKGFKFYFISQPSHRKVKI
jgi:hypothetical protein